MYNYTLSELPFAKQSSEIPSFRKSFEPISLKLLTCLEKNFVLVIFVFVFFGEVIYKGVLSEHFLVAPSYLFEFLKDGCFAEGAEFLFEV